MVCSGLDVKTQHRFRKSSEGDWPRQTSFSSVTNVEAKRCNEDFCDVPSLGLWLQSFIFDLNMKKMSAEVSRSQRRNENLGLTSRFFSCSFCELVSVVGVLCGQWSKQTDLRSGWSDPDWSSVWAASPDHKPFYFLLKTRPKQRRRDRREIRFLYLKKPFVCQIDWFKFQLKNTLLDDIKKIQKKILDKCCLHGLHLIYDNLEFLSSLERPGALQNKSLRLCVGDETSSMNDHSFFFSSKYWTYWFDVCHCAV